MIHIEKGYLKSLLINLKTFDTRECLTSELDTLDGTEELSEKTKIKRSLIKEGFDYYNLDIHLDEPTNKCFKEIVRNKISTQLKLWNFRILINSNISYKTVLDLVEYLNTNYCHFGVIVFASKDYLEKYEPYFLNNMSCRFEDKDPDIYTPSFIMSEDSIYFSEQNIYYASRLSLHIKRDNIIVDDNQKYNISKHIIEVCKDCQYKCVCVDSRKVNLETHSYESVCSYDPYTDTWKNQE
ncbi:MAG: hypothetical protein AAGA77_22375 [Bacteroidota bacterium]